MRPMPMTATFMRALPHPFYDDRHAGAAMTATSASATASATIPSCALTGWRAAREDGIAEAFEFDAQRLAIGDGVACHRAFGDARDRALTRCGGEVLVERQRLGGVIDDEHAFFAEDRQRAFLRGREPVDIEHAKRATAETQHAGEEVFVVGVDVPPRLGEDALHIVVQQVAHDVDVVRREVVDDAHIADAVRKRPDAAGAKLEHAAALAGFESRLELPHRRIEALDVADREQARQRSAAAAIRCADAMVAAIGFSTSKLAPAAITWSATLRAAAWARRPRRAAAASPRAASRCRGSLGCCVPPTAAATRADRSRRPPRARRRHVAEARAHGWHPWNQGRSQRRERFGHSFERSAAVVKAHLRSRSLAASAPRHAVDRRRDVLHVFRAERRVHRNESTASAAASATGNEPSPKPSFCMIGCW